MKTLQALTLLLLTFSATSFGYIEPHCNPARQFCVTLDRTHLPHNLPAGVEIKYKYGNTNDYKTEKHLVHLLKPRNIVWANEAGEFSYVKLTMPSINNKKLKNCTIEKNDPYIVGNVVLRLHRYWLFGYHYYCDK